MAESAKWPIEVQKFHREGFDFLEGLLSWVHERPAMYCCLAGELDSTLHYLHLIWAKMTNRESELQSARISAGERDFGIISDEERHCRVQADDGVTKRILSFWLKVDQVLGIKNPVSQSDVLN
jgi:hypothetical protein